MKINVLNLFSGIEGFLKGLLQAGFEVENHYTSEIDTYAKAITKFNFPKSIELGDVRHVRGCELETIDVITFGSPCQDFSLAGKREGMEGKRSSLITEAIRLIDELRPKFFVWENVKGTFSSNSGADFWAIIKAFTNLGAYRLEWQLLNTAWVLPQNRERIYLVGTLGEGNGREIFPIRESDQRFNQESRSKRSRLGREPARAITKGGRLDYETETFIKVGTYRTHNDGRGFRSVKDNISPTIPARAREDGSGQPVVSIGAIRGRNPENPKARVAGQPTKQMLEINEHDRANTLTSVQKDNVVIDPPRIRRLTPIECERLQGFPDDWTKYGNFNGEIKEISDTQRYKCLGNAVTVDIVQMVGERIKSALQ